MLDQVNMEHEHIIAFYEGWNDSWLKYSKSEKNTAPDDSFCSVRFKYCPICGIELIWEPEVILCRQIETARRIIDA